MYLEYWGMQVRPFANVHAPEFHVAVTGAKLARAKLRYAFAAELGAAVLLGEAGVGKTELARMIIHDLEAEGWVTGYMVIPAGSIDGILGVMSNLLGEENGESRGEPLERMMRKISEFSRGGRRVCMVIDEVHAMRDIQVLEVLRMLLGQEYESRNVVNLLFVGQEGMEGKLRQASGLESHIALRMRLGPMSMEDTKKYMLFRLKMAGCSRGIFTRHAAELVHEFSRGIARNINRLCELALVTGFGLGMKKIGPDVVQMAAQDLGMIPAASQSTPSASRDEDILAGISG